ncbi:heterokaryon incompatibility protein-domain-containing protein [Scleroderma citrinum]
MRLIDVNAFLARDELRGGTIDWWWGVSLESEVLKDFPDGEKEYAILSHRWKEEVDYTEMAELMRFKPEDRVKIKGRAGYQKILNSCKQAKAEKIEWLWADTCCIDKRSSSELSEAINSMYRWYENSKICYTYLHDVDVEFFPTGPNGKKFPKSDGWPEWFSRGWTLQELIAPRNLKFFNKDWKLVGTKEELAGDLNKITRIPEDVLKHGLTSNRPCVAQIMSWAANRKTTRDEDRAYSLLGLLDVNMPMLYGEGKNAFQRLQLDIIRKSDDQSIFAWGHGGRGGGTCSVLADDPSFFRDCHDIVKIEPDEFDFHLRARLRVTGSPLPDERGSFSVTNQGIRIWLLVTPHEKSETFFRAVLACCRWDRRPITIDLASWGSSYYRYPSTPKVPKTIPKLQRLYLSYHPEVYPDCVFELEGVHRTLTSRGFTSRGLFPLESHNTRNLHYGKSSHVLSGVNALSVLVYEKGHRPKTRFAVVSGYFHGHPWVHVTLDDHEEGNSQEYAESVYNQTWAAGTHRIARSSLLNNTHVHLTSPGWANCAVEHRCTEYGKPNESTFSKVTIKLVRCTTKHCDEQKSLDVGYRTK